jgi:hypothetical protein
MLRMSAISPLTKTVHRHLSAPMDLAVLSEVRLRPGAREGGESGGALYVLPAVMSHTVLRSESLTNRDFPSGEN